MTVTYQFPADSTDVSVVIRIIDSTDGTPETGVVFNTSGIDLEYRREGAASVDITEATLAALTTAHTDGGFLHIGNGYYRLDLPDAAVANGSAGCLVHGTVTGMVVIGCYIQIGARINANVTHVGGATTDVSALATNVAAILVDTGTTLDGRIPAALIGGRIDANLGAISTDATAADNAEAFFDGTGYAGTNNVIPTVTTVTNAVSANVTQISGDTTAADNAELFFDGTGYAGTNNVIPTVTAVTNQVTANVTAISGDSTAADNLETAFDDTAGRVPWTGVIDQGTAQSATSSTLVLRSAATFGDNTVIGALITAHGSTQGYDQTRYCTDYDNATDTATVDPAWDVTPSGTILYKIRPGAPAPTTNPVPANVVQVDSRALVAAGSDTPQYGVES